MRLNKKQCRQIAAVVESRSVDPEIETQRAKMLKEGLSRKAAEAVTVDEQSALSLSAVWRAVTLIGQMVGRLPLNVYEFIDGNEDDRRRDRSHPAEYLLNIEASPDVDAAMLRESMTMLAVTWGHAEAVVIRRPNGSPYEMHLLYPWETIPGVSEDGQRVFWNRPADEEPRGYYASDVLSIVGPSPDGVTGYEPIKIARRSLANAVAMEVFGTNFFANGARPGGAIKVPGDFTDEQWTRLRKSFDEMYASAAKAGKTLMLEGGAEFTPYPINNNEAQYVEGRTFQVNEVARWFGIPPHLLFELSRATFSNIEEMGQGWLIYGLSAWLDRWERACRRTLLLTTQRMTHYIEYNTDKLLRANAQSRYTNYQIGRNAGFLSVNEIRRAENKSSIGPAGDVYLQPLNMEPARPADAAKPAAEPQPKPQTMLLEPPERPEVESPSDASLPPAKFSAAIRSELIDAAGRALAIQANAANRSAKKPEQFGEWLSKFPTELRDKSAEIVAPIARLGVVMLGLDEGADLLANAIAERLVVESRDLLGQAYGEGSHGDELAKRVEAATATWRERAAGVVDAVLKQTG